MAFDFLRAVTEGKAFQTHPALTSREPAGIYSPGAGRDKATLTQREAPRHLEAYGGSESIDWLMDCVNLYAETTSTAPWHLERDGKRVVFEDWQKEEDDDLVINDFILRTLLDEPNPHMDYAEMIELLVIDLLVVGNAYWMKWNMTDEGKPLALYRMAPAHVKIKPGPFGPKGYEYQPPGAKRPLKLDPAEVVHLRRPNPHSHYYGLGVIQGGGRSFDLELALTESQASYFENRAQPSMVVQAERRVPRDVFKKLYAQLRARATGPSRSGDLLVLESGLRAETLSPNAREAMFEELSKLSRDRIYAKFRAHPKLFGLAGGADAQDKVADVRREFDTQVMRPFLDKLQKRLTRALFSAWDLSYIIDYRHIVPPQDLIKQTGDLASMPGIKVKEVREQLGPLGIKRSTGDTDIDEMVLNLPGEELDENGQGGFADQPLPGEAGRPPKQENTRAFPRGRTAAPPNTRARRPGAKAAPETWASRLSAAEGKATPVKLDPPERTSVGKLSAEQRPDDVLASRRNTDVDAIAGSMIPDLQTAAHVLERGLLDHAEGKAFNADTLVSRIKKSESWRTFASMVAGALEAGTRAGLSTAFIHHGSSGYTLPDDADYDAITKRLVYRKDGAPGISRTLRDEIAQKVAKTLNDSGQREDVERAIRESIMFWKEGKAETVALTEAVHAYNEGTLVIAEANGSTDVYVEDGDDHDEPCKEANGSTWAISEARERRLEHPRCRRAFIPVPAAA